MKHYLIELKLYAQNKSANCIEASAVMLQPHEQADKKQQTNHALVHWIIAKLAFNKNLENVMRRNK